MIKRHDGSVLQKLISHCVKFGLGAIKSVSCDEERRETPSEVHTQSFTLEHVAVCSPLLRKAESGEKEKKNKVLPQTEETIASKFSGVPDVDLLRTHLKPETTETQRCFIYV